MTGKGISEPRRVTVVLELQHIELIKRQLLSQSMYEGRHITLSEGVRRAVEHCYPVPEQLEIPGTEKKTRRKNKNG